MSTEEVKGSGQADPASAYVVKMLVDALTSAAGELESRAKGLRHFAGLIAKEAADDPSLEVFKGSCLTTNVVREFTDAMRQNHNHTLPQIVGYANQLTHGRP